MKFSASVLVIVFFATGCSSPLETAEPSAIAESPESLEIAPDSLGANEQDPSVARSEKPDDGPESPFAYDSPVAAHFGIKSGMSRIEHQEREERIASCMRLEGFEYTPEPYDAEIFGLPVDPADPVFGTDSWFEEYGFGITTQAFTKEEVGPGLAGRSYTANSADDGPNANYVASLDDTTYDAYQVALTGFDSIDDEGGEGCIEQSLTDGLDLDAFRAQFRDELTAMSSGIWEHPRLEEARDEAAVCLRGLGVEPDRYREVQFYFSARLDEVLAAAPVEQTSMPEDEEEFSDDPGRVWDPSSQSRLPDAALRILADVQSEERSLARQFRECNAPMEMWDGYGDPQIVAIRIELEEQFLSQNSDQIEAFLLDQG